MDNIIENICYTELVYERVNKKMRTQMSPSEIEAWIQNVLHQSDCVLEQRGKNFYVSCISENVILTVNSYNYRLITVNQITK